VKHSLVGKPELFYRYHYGKKNNFEDKNAMETKEG
jgi:hypothetical protein